MELTRSASGRAAVGANLLAARISLELGRLDDARAALMRALEMADLYSTRTPHAIGFALLAEPLDFSDRLDEFLTRFPGGSWLEIARLVAAGEFSEAARRLDEAGDLSLAAQVRLRSPGGGELARAIDFFAAVAATRYLTRAEAQLAAMA